MRSSTVFECELLSHLGAQGERAQVIAAVAALSVRMRLRAVPAKSFPNCDQTKSQTNIWP